LLKRIVVMCGIFHFIGPNPDPCLSEWSALCDSRVNGMAVLNGGTEQKPHLCADTVDVPARS
jgi:hypothetical protein